MEMEGRGWIRGSCIGKGSFGTVSLAYDKSNGQSFAIKSVVLNCNSHPAAISSLEKEIQILQSLKSPYVVTYLGESTTKESSNMCRNLHMEYIPSGTIAELATTVPMTEANIRSYTRCIAQALQFLHSIAGVVHSDVKGRNVLIGCEPGVAKLIDFGSARRIGTMNEHELIGGTPFWMAPEVARGELASPESDIWSLGCTVIEMATGGGHPWGSNYNSCCDQSQLLFLIGYGTELPELPSWLSKQGQDFLDKCLRRNAGERWTAEMLLQHPFLAEAVINGDCVLDARPSPRSVLDHHWGNSEFDDEEEAVTDNGRERIRELASDGGMLEWNWDNGDDDNDGWEVVRTCSSSEEEEEEEQGMVGEYSDSCNGKLEDCDQDDTNEAASGSGLSSSYSYCCNCNSCCYSHCCKFGWWCMWSFSCWSCKILSFCFRLVNIISSFFLCFFDFTNRRLTVFCYNIFWPRTQYPC